MHMTKTTTQDSPIRVFLFADYPMVLESLKHFVDLNRDLTVSAALDDYIDNDPNIALYGPRSDVAVLFIGNREQVCVIPQLLKSNPAIRIVVAADTLDMESQAEALRLGAVGIVQTNQNCKLLLEAIRQT